MDKQSPRNYLFRSMPEHKHLRRLSRVWIRQAIYFVTICTHHRRPLLATNEAALILIQEWSTASARHGWLIGRFVIMSDHVHFFCAEQSAGAQHPFTRFVASWKEWTSKGLAKALAISPPVWQKQFFDHVLRSDESYAEKWAYVRNNPVRAGLVSKWEDWTYQGYVDFDAPGQG